MIFQRLASNFLRRSQNFYSRNTRNCNGNEWGLVLLVPRRGLARRLECMYKVGDCASLSRTFSAEDLQTLANLTLDFNPIHLDPEYAKNTRYRKCIVHGVLINGLISAVFATHLPGPGAVYLSSKLVFPNALFVDEPVTAEIAVTDVKGMAITCATLATATDRNQIVLKGEAQVLVPKSKMKIVDVL